MDTPVVPAGETLVIAVRVATITACLAGVEEQTTLTTIGVTPTGTRGHPRVRAPAELTITAWRHTLMSPRTTPTSLVSRLHTCVS